MSLPTDAELVAALRVVAAFEAVVRVDAAAGGLYWPDTALPYSRPAILAALRLLWTIAGADGASPSAEAQAWRLLALVHALGSYVSPAAAPRLDSAARRVQAGGEIPPGESAELRAALAAEAVLVAEVTAALVEDLAVAPAPAA